VFDVISENRFFQSRDSVEWAELAFSVNGAKWGPDHPGLPLLQAEKVVTLPLDLRLTNDYRYRLDGIEAIGERRCYVVAFDPIDDRDSRYRGRVWIDSRSFVRIKVDSVQTNLHGQVVSNEEAVTYEPVAAANGQPIYLATRVTTKQLLLIAGRTLLLEKEQWYSDFHVDAAAFLVEREAARSGDHVMFRDTDAGVRYLVKRDGERVVSNAIRNSSRALAMGTTIDPTFAFPLPILGINYLNFGFPNRNSQLALLFGGVFAAGNIQVPKLGSTPLDASVDFFGIAVPSSDIRFDAAGERLDERLYSIPVTTGVNVGYQFTPFQKLAAGYTYRYDKFFNDPDTAPDFVTPVSTSTYGVSIGYEFKRHGYSIGTTASTFRRASWEPWGRAGDFDPAAKTYARYSVGVSKDVLLGPFQSVHIGGAWYDGRRLDRFSMYQFGLFDELRMHGVPSSGIRFGALALMHASYSFNVLNIYKIDLFFDQAIARDPEDRSVRRPVTGTGIAVNLKAPWNTMFSVDVGKSFLPAIYRPAGSVVLQLMLLKPL
ncbi:MAG: sigma-E factor regulatory protein RseB domain-containing protein, partial [Acidobacteriota bacterium]